MPNEIIKVGCCGFRRSQEKYYELFKLVEVQHTFYSPPQLKTLERWRNDAPKNFEFSVKAYQLITHLGDSPTYRRLKKQPSDEALQDCGHFQPTKTVFEAYKITLACAKILKSKLILFQCPPRFSPEEGNIENMKNFFSNIERPKGITFLWEPRGKWPEALIEETCSELNLQHVVDPFINTCVTQGLKYYRLHGRGRKNQRYKLTELMELRKSIFPDETTYVLFNNVYMLEDAQEFLKII
jgi:uncharacterized protein YecE (DUF72 family)